MTAEVINDGYEVIKEFTVIFEFTTLCKCFRCFCRTYVHNGSLQSHFKIKDMILVSTIFCNSQSVTTIWLVVQAGWEQKWERGRHKLTSC